MKTVPFVKMNGAGNDFVIIESQKKINYRRFAIHACHRTDGVGADGLLVLDRSKKADYRMRIFNADGSEAEMCGNGVRCLAAYILKTHHPSKKIFSIETLTGMILAKKNKNLISVRLTDPKDYLQDITLHINGRSLHVSYMDTGVPHAICFVENLKDLNIDPIGKVIRYDKKFKPRGTNVNFVEQINSRFIAVRTYERGVESETRACGTGSVASAIVSFLKANPKIDQKQNASMNVKTISGKILEVRFDLLGNKTITNVWLKGNAQFIAEGKIYCSSY